MDIEHLGEQTIDLFVTEGLMNDVGDLYTLDFQRIQSFEGFGETSVNNLQRAIESSKSKTLANLILASQFHTLEEQTQTYLLCRLGHLDLIIEASLDELEAIEGLGPVIAGSVFNYFREPNIGID